jgi:hypothetical protein
VHEERDSGECEEGKESGVLEEERHLINAEK